MPTTPEATREMKTTFHCADRQCQKAACVAVSACECLPKLQGDYQAAIAHLGNTQYLVYFSSNHCGIA